MTFLKRHNDVLTTRTDDGDVVIALRLHLASDKEVAVTAQFTPDGARAIAESLMALADGRGVSIPIDDWLIGLAE